MSYSPIAYTLPQYEDYANWWLKAYEQGTTTPLAMATDAAAGTTLAKAELNADGFPVTAGAVKFIPFINGDYDIWLFPTSAEADANDTTNAIQLADNINADPVSLVTPAAIGAATYVDNVAALVASSFAAGTIVETKGYTTAGDGGVATYLIKIAAQAASDGDVIDGFGNHTLANGNVAVLQLGDSINALTFGVANSIDSKLAIQAAQDRSEALKIPIDFSRLTDVVFSGGIVYGTWLHWKGAGRFNTTFTPIDKTEALVGDNWYVSKRDKTASVTFFLMEDFGVDGEWAGGSPAAGQFLGWATVESNGSNDKDITYLRLHLVDIPFDVCGGYVVKASGGTIDGIRMLFCSGGTNHPGVPNSNANMFKTMHGQIDDPGAYGVYPITNIVSFGNTCTHMRSLCDFKRGSRAFTHNASEVIDMSDVCSISTDGSKDGTIGPDNTGYQTAAFADAKNFYEIQGEDIEILGGVWDANNRTGVVAGLFVTDYTYPAETVAGVYDSNPSVNVHCRAMTVRNILPLQSAVRYLNTKFCDVRGVRAYDIGYAAVTFEYVAGRKDVLGGIVIPQGNTVDDVREVNCLLSVDAAVGNNVRVGENIYNEDGQQDLAINNIAGTGVVFQYEPTYSAQELNSNQYFKTYGGAATAVIDWGIGTATRLYQTTDKPLGAPNALTLEDTDAGSIQETTAAFNVPVSLGDILYLSVLVKAGTAPSSGLNIQEFNGGVFVANNFIDLAAGVDWEERVRKFVCSNASTDRVLIKLLPAANDNGDSAQTGTTLFANLRISRKLNNL